MTNQAAWIYEGVELRRNGERRPPKKDEYFLRDHVEPCRAACDFRDNEWNQVHILVPVTFETQAVESN